MSKAKREKKTPPGGTGITDIEHEEVQQTEQPKAETKVVEVTEITTEEQIKLEVAKLPVADIAIGELKAKYGELTIAGVDDKEGYKVVKAAWNEIRTVRTGLEKKGLEIRSRISQITKAVSKEEDRLIDLISPLEEDLKKKWKDIDDAKEKAEKEKADAEQKRLLDRIQELMGMGMTLTDGMYRIGDTISIDAATLRAFPDEQYLKLKGAVELKSKEIAAEKQKEEDRKKKEREDLEREKEELRAQRREVRIGKLEQIGMTISGTGAEEVAVFQWIRIYTTPLLDLTTDEWNKALETTSAEIKKYKADEENKKVRTDRTEQVKALGFIVKGTDFFFDNGHKTISHGIESLIGLDQYGFEEHFKIVEGLVKEANEAKEKNDKEKAEELRLLNIKKKLISDSLDAVGMSFNYSQDFFYFQNDQGAIKKTWNDFLPLDEREISLKAQGLYDEIADLKKKDTDAKADKERKEKEEKELSMTDSERWQATMQLFKGQLPAPDSFKTKEFQNKAKRLADFLMEVNGK